MLIAEASRVLACLCAGEILAGSGILPFPGPVIGLVFLYGNLALIGEVPKPLGRIADNVLGVLGMLFVPTGVGLLAYLDLLREELVPIVTAIFGGTLITIIVTALAAKSLVVLDAEKRRSAEQEAPDAAV
jgi:holin-like protein